MAQNLAPLDATVLPSLSDANEVSPQKGWWDKRGRNVSRGVVRQGNDKTRQSKARQNKTRQDKTRLDKSRQDKQDGTIGKATEVAVWSRSTNGGGERGTNGYKRGETATETEAETSAKEMTKKR